MKIECNHAECHKTNDLFGIGQMPNQKYYCAEHFSDAMAKQVEPFMESLHKYVIDLED